eukprot:1186395-Prorocentrum_minimum.AAC.2
MADNPESVPTEDGGADASAAPASSEVTGEAAVASETVETADASTAPGVKPDAPGEAPVDAPAEAPTVVPDAEAPETAPADAPADAPAADASGTGTDLSETANGDADVVQGENTDEGERRASGAGANDGEGEEEEEGGDGKPWVPTRDNSKKDMSKLFNQVRFGALGSLLLSTLALVQSQSIECSLTATGEEVDSEDERPAAQGTNGWNGGNPTGEDEGEVRG